MARSRPPVLLTLLGLIVLIASVAYISYQVATVEVPVSGGTYVEGVAGNPRMINPILCHANPVDRDIASLVFSGLVRAETDGTIVPDLAERWEISPDETIYTFYLRQDVTWHDGAPFTADDVVYTLTAIQDPNYAGAAFLAEMWRNVVIQKLDIHTVRFVLREPFTPFLDYATVGILPAHILGGISASDLPSATFNATPIGTGPWKIEQVSARSVSLVPHPAYYRADENNGPFLDRITFRFYPSLTAVYEAYTRGEISGISRVLPEHLEFVRQAPNLTLYSAPLSGYTLVFLNLDRAVFQDRAVRQAIMWALDRQALVDEVLHGQGIVLDTPILPNSWAFDPDAPTYHQDTQKARAVLEEAGWLDPDEDGVRSRGAVQLAFTLATNEGDAARQAMIECISEQLAEIGIQVETTVVPWDELIQDQLRRRRYDAILGGWESLPPDPDPYAYWHSTQVSENGLNFGGYINPDADRLLETARATTDLDLRRDLYYRFQRLFVEDVPAILLYQPIYSYAVDADVRGVQVGPTIDGSDRLQTSLDWYMATERVFYAKAREMGIDYKLPWNR
ncbi:MAG: ABC transporter substrate-binding protein [Anaerolineae bacterium]